MEQLDVEEAVKKASFLLDEGELQKAQRLVKKALLTHKEHWGLLMILGECKAAMGQYVQAATAFGKAAKASNGDTGWALSSMAQANLDAGNLAKARQVIEEALRVNRDNVHSNYVNAIIYEFESRFEVADFFYSRAAMLNPDVFFMPFRTSEEEFDEILKEVMTELYQEEPFWRINSPRVRVRNLPRLGVEDGGSVLRLSEIKQFCRGDSYDSNPSIYVYKLNIERLCKSRNDLYDEIKLSLV